MIDPRPMLAEIELLESRLRSAQLAAAGSGNDLLALGLLCRMGEDEYPRKAVERHVGELRDMLKYLVEIIEHEVPPHTCTCNACGDCASACYFAENMRKARALLVRGEGQP